MIDELTLLSVVLASIATVMVIAIALQRKRLARRHEDRSAREDRLRPLALLIAEGVPPSDPVDPSDVDILAALVGRYGRHLRGDARERVAAFFSAFGVVAGLVQDMKSPKSWKRATAAAALGDMGAREAIGPLRVALTDADSDVRTAAATALGRLGAVEAIDSVTRAIAEGAVPRSAGANALLELGPEALPSLQPLARDPQAPVRATALEIIGLLGSGADKEFPVHGLYDHHPTVRRAAATALGRIADREAAAGLRHALIDPAAEVRAAAARALGRIGDRSVADDLMHLATHDSFDVAHAAAAALTVLDPRLVVAARGSVRAPALREAADLIAIGAA